MRKRRDPVAYTLSDRRFQQRIVKSKKAKSRLQLKKELHGICMDHREKSL
jgi:hypothetical protein